MPPTLEARDLTKRYGAVLSVDGVSLAIRPAEILGVFGPNGAGCWATRFGLRLKARTKATHRQSRRIYHL